jgi:hypothetical protein
VDLLLTVIAVLFGVLLLLLSLAGLAFGAFMATDQRTRRPGMFFVLWWIPATAAAIGLLLRDPAAFTVGAFCFLVAGGALVLEHRGSRGSTRERRTRPRKATKKRPPSEETETSQKAKAR